MRSTRLFSALLVSFLISTILTSTPPPVSAQSYDPGVGPGDWLFYGEVSAGWNVSIIQPISPFRDFNQTNSIRLEVQKVDGSNITATQTWDLRNQTEPKNVTITLDVQTGPETLMIPWFTAQELTAGDMIYDYPQSPIINQTLSRTYAGAPRLVNLLNATQPLQGYLGVYVRMVIYWDRPTGAALEFTLTAYGQYFGVPLSASLYFKATDTSLWPNSMRPDFTLSANPASLTIEAGSYDTFTLNMTNTGRVQANVTILIQATPTGPNIQPATWNQLLQIGQVGFKTVTVFTNPETPAGNYAITVTAKAGSAARVVRLMLTVTPVPSFDLIPSENPVILREGTAHTLTISLFGTGGFAGIVKLNVTVSPSGPAATLSHDSVLIPISGPATSVLTIFVPASSSRQAYQIIVTGTGGGRTVTVTILLEVQPAANTAAAATIFGLQPYQFAISVSILLLAGSTFFLFRRRLFAKLASVMPYLRRPMTLSIGGQGFVNNH